MKTGMKRCFKCKRKKPLRMFYAHPMMADGHLGKCKSCAKRDVSSNYRAKRSKYSEYDRMRFKRPERRKKALLYQAKTRRLYPGKASARRAVALAIMSGRLVRGKCEVCGHPRTEAHHEDYRKKLDVRWLCFKHHREAHGQVVTSERRDHGAD